MVYKENENDSLDIYALPRGRIRISITVTEDDFGRIVNRATLSETSEAATIATALSLGLSVLEGPRGLDLLEGLAMLRFLRGRSQS
jgi:hypothetical protein